MNYPEKLTPEELKELDEFILDCALDNVKSGHKQSSQEEK